MSDMPEKNQSPQQSEMQSQEPIRIPVDTPQPSPRGEIAPDVDQLVRDYEARYKGMRDGEPDIVAETIRDSDPFRDLFPKMKRKHTPVMRTGMTTEQERTWAAVAHISALITLLVGVPTAGVGLLATLLIPLMIFLYYREKSSYFACH